MKQELQRVETMGFGVEHRPTDPRWFPKPNLWPLRSCYFVLNIPPFLKPETEKGYSNAPKRTPAKKNRCGALLTAPVVARMRMKMRPHWSVWRWVCHSENRRINFQEIHCFTTEIQLFYHHFSRWTWPFGKVYTFFDLQNQGTNARFTVSPGRVPSFV